MVEGRSLNGVDLLVWVATLVAFPIAGLAGRAVAGPVDTVWTAALAGVIAGAVIGAAQWLALRRIGADLRWIAATAVGLAVGLALAFAIFGYGDTVGDLAVVGAVTGLGIGIAHGGYCEPSSTAAWCGCGYRRAPPFGRWGGP